MSTARRPKPVAKKPTGRPAKRTAKKPPDDAVNGAPVLPPGHWVAWDREQKKVLAIGDNFWEVLQKGLATGEAEPHVERTPGIHPAAAARPFTLHEWEAPDILDDIRVAFAGYVDRWLDTPSPCSPMRDRATSWGPSANRSCGCTSAKGRLESSHETGRLRPTATASRNWHLVSGARTSTSGIPSRDGTHPRRAESFFFWPRSCPAV
jgi:hypothetical protein